MPIKTVFATTGKNNQLISPPVGRKSGRCFFRHKMKTIFTFAAFAVGIVSLIFAQDTAKRNDNFQVSVLSEADIESIRYMREEEKLAHDVYLFYAEQYAIPVFRNILRSETAHQKAVIWLMDKYGIKDLSKEMAGEFNYPGLQKMYNDLVKGATLIDALEAGAFIEEHDIQDLENYLKKTDNPDIKRIYSNLIRGSENHLRAFSNNLTRRGAEYQPKILILSRFSEIIQR